MVEDNPGDVQLLEQALNETDHEFILDVVDDGDDCIAFIHQVGKFRNAFRPDIVLLDLNLPRKSGQAVLYERKNDVDLKEIPFVVLTGSRNEQDILNCADLDADGFVIKPQTWDQFLSLANFLGKFVKREVTLPPIWLDNLTSDPGDETIALSSATDHLKKAANVGRVTDPQKDWAMLLVMALNIKAALDAIREHRNKVRTNHGIYTDIEFDSPWLASRTHQMKHQLLELEKTTERLTGEVESMSSDLMNSLDPIRKKIRKILGGVRIHIIKEQQLIDDHLFEPPAGD